MVSSGGRAEASILHADLDSFYASVEQRDDPARGRPVLVGGVSCWRRATRPRRWAYTPRCPAATRASCRGSAVVVSPRFSAYTEASHCRVRRLSRHDALVEGISVDEAFLDVGIAAPHQRDSGTDRGAPPTDPRRGVGLPITVGAARSKFLAKVASAVGKARRAARRAARR